MNWFTVYSPGQSCSTWYDHMVAPLRNSYPVLYWIHFPVLIVKQLAEYFVVVLQVISEFSSLEFRLGNPVVEATIIAAQQEFVKAISQISLLSVHHIRISLSVQLFCYYCSNYVLLLVVFIVNSKLNIQLYLRTRVWFSNFRKLEQGMYNMY